MTEKYLSQLSTFHTGSLRRILRIFWPNVISNKDVFRRRCRWIVHVTRQDASIAKTTLYWTPEGKREGPPQENLAVDSRERNFGDGGGLGVIKLMAIDEQMWREHVAALNAT